jgi:hypothetical protein
MAISLQQSSNSISFRSFFINCGLTVQKQNLIQFWWCKTKTFCEWCWDTWILKGIEEKPWPYHASAHCTDCRTQDKSAWKSLVISLLTCCFSKSIITLRGTQISSHSLVKADHDGHQVIASEFMVWIKWLEFLKSYGSKFVSYWFGPDWSTD